MKESSLKLLGIPRIVESNFKLNRDYKFIKGEKLNFGLEVHSNVGEVKEKDDLYICSLTIKFKEEKDKMPFTLTVTVEGLFQITGDKEIFKEVLKVNGPAILLSYVRPHISNLTLAAGIDPVILPLLDFTKD